MLSARGIYIVLFLTVYFLIIYWWFINPYDSLEKEVEEPKEIIKIAQSPIFDPMTMKLLSVEYQDLQFISKSEDDIVQNEEKIVALGEIALPTLLFYLKNTEDIQIQNKLFQIICDINGPGLHKELENILKVGSNQLRLLCINAIGDRDFKDFATVLKKMLLNKNPRDSEYIPLSNALVKLGDGQSARIAFEEYVKTKSVKFRYEAIENIADLGFKESIPVLKNQLPNLKPESDEYFQIHKCLLKLGDSSYLDELINMGLYLKINQSKVLDALISFQPIRDNFRILERGDTIVLLIEDELMLKAIDEWYHEKILKKPSPYQSTKEAHFSEPYASEKYHAWNNLIRVCYGSTFNPSGLRVYSNDIKITELDVQREITLISGVGHGGSLNIFVCSPGVDDVEIFCFKYKSRGKKSACFSKKIGLKIYRDLIVGLKTIFEARVDSWWNENFAGNIWSSHDFVVSFIGLEKDESEVLSFCGYKTSNNEINYVKLITAESLFLEKCNFESEIVPSEASSGAKNIFSKVFMKEFKKNKIYYEWVRSCLIEMACEYGDNNLIEFLMKILTNAYTEKKNDLASRAIDAIAKISKKDFRYNEDGSLKEIDSIVKNYIEWYKDFQPTGY